MTTLECRCCYSVFVCHDGDDGRCPRCDAPYVLDAHETTISMLDDDSIVPFTFTVAPQPGAMDIAD